MVCIALKGLKGSLLNIDKFLSLFQAALHGEDQKQWNIIERGWCLTGEILPGTIGADDQESCSRALRSGNRVSAEQKALRLLKSELKRPSWKQDI